MREIRVTDVLDKLDRRDNESYHLELFSDFSGFIKYSNGNVYKDFECEEHFKEVIVQLDFELKVNNGKEINIKL